MASRLVSRKVDVQLFKPSPRNKSKIRSSAGMAAFQSVVIPYFLICFVGYLMDARNLRNGSRGTAKLHSRKLHVDALPAPFRKFPWGLVLRDCSN